MKRNQRPPAPRADLPTPLAQVLAELDRETQPFRAVHRLIDAVEVLIKLHTVILVSRFVEALEREAPGHGPALRKLLAGGLRTPSLGIWWAFARETGKALAEADLAEPVPGLFKAVAQRSPLFVALEGADSLLALRNAYAHGATPDDDVCRADLEAARPRLDRLLDAAWPLAEADLIAVRSDDQCVRLRGLSPAVLPAPAGGRAGRCYLARADGTLLDLHPLLVWAEAVGKGEGAFFYNDTRKNHACALHYAWARHERKPEWREDLLARYPLDEWNGQTCAEEAAIRERISALTEDFKGRRAELQALMAWLAGRDSGVRVVWGPPGVGKSALMARAIDYLSWSDDTRRLAYPELTLSAVDDQTLKVVVVRGFVRRGSFVDVREIFENLNRQLDRFRSTGAEGAANATEAAQRLRERLQRISATLSENERLVVVIDGLDEAAEHAEFVRGLPRHAPPRVHLLYASRPHPVLRSELYEQFEITQRSEETLGGLSPADTRALLYDHADKYALEKDWVDAVAERSQGNPLYLRLLCDALERREIDLNRIDRLPKEMGTLYGGVMDRLAKTAHAHDLLALLAAAHERLPTAVVHHLLGLRMPKLSLHAVREALRACSEVLIDDPSRPEEWQLFHESLREYLHATCAARVVEWQCRLAQWGRDWRLLSALPSLSPRDRRAAEVYALRRTAIHLDETARSIRSVGCESDLRDVEDQLIALVEDEAWRVRSFLLCGNAEALRHAIQLAQQIAVARYRSTGSSVDALRVAKLAQWTWGEEGRLYERQRLQLKSAHRNHGTHWRDVVSLASMGPTPRDKLMLACLALWGDRGRWDSAPEFGADDQRRFREWREESDDPAVSTLWRVLGGP
jgi:hypothetical protein